MSVQHFTFKGSPVSKKNSYRRGQNGGMFKPAEVTAFEEAVGWELRAQKFYPVEGPFVIVATFTLKNKLQDLDNVFTSLLDALEKGGLFKNDRELVQAVIRKRVDKENPHVTLSIETLDDYSRVSRDSVLERSLSQPA